MGFKFKTSPNLEEKVAIVTGANVGLGYETTKAFASAGMTVVMACRNTDKAEEAKEQILKEIPSAKLKVLCLDLNGLKCVIDFVQHFKNDFDRLDILVNNAGLMMPMFFKTQDGHESQFGVNYLAHFYLSSLLLPLLEQSPDGRIISLASLAHDWGEIYFDHYMADKTKYNKRKAYGQSKLACLMFGYELDRRLKGRSSSVKSIPVHPGGSLTNLGRHLPAFLINLIGLLGLASKPAQGAESQIYASLSSDAVSGKYYGPTGFREMKGPVGKAESNEYSKDLEINARLWEESEKMVGSKFFI